MPDPFSRRQEPLVFKGFVCNRVFWCKAPCEANNSLGGNESPESRVMSMRAALILTALAFCAGLLVGEIHRALYSQRATDTASFAALTETDGPSTVTAEC